jgi:lipoprotein-releasing system permease protein
MIGLAAGVAVRHLLARKRQSVVSLSGIVLGVAFFLAVAGMMQGTENDFIKRLDNSPHITIEDEFRNPRLQPLETLYPDGAIQIRRVKPVYETRGVRGYVQILENLGTIPDLRASPMLAGQALVSFAGKDYGISLNGVIPADLRSVSTIGNYIVGGSIDDLTANADGIVIGSELARKLSLALGNNITVAATTGAVHTFKVVGIFRTGRASFDEGQAFTTLKRVQALLNRPNRVNEIIVKLTDPNQARDTAARIEDWIGYKSVSWQEASEDLMNLLILRKVIMYAIVSAVLVVAAFGIYNVISTVVMEKDRDIAILKSIGFHGRDIQTIFLIEGAILGAAGCLLGLPLGAAMMYGVSGIYFRPPGSTETIYMAVDWGWPPFVIAVGFALAAALSAAFFPARKGAHVRPVDILRGGF